MSSFVHNTKEVNDNSMKDVRQTVLTFNTQVHGISTSVVLGSLNQFISYGTNQISISSVCSQIIVLAMGRLMETTLSTRKTKLPITKQNFSKSMLRSPTLQIQIILVFMQCIDICFLHLLYSCWQSLYKFQFARLFVNFSS